MATTAPERRLGVSAIPPVIASPAESTARPDTRYGPGSRDWKVDAEYVLRAADDHALGFGWIRGPGEVGRAVTRQIDERRPHVDLTNSGADQVLARLESGEAIAPEVVRRLREPRHVDKTAAPVDIPHLRRAQDHAFDRIAVFIQYTTRDDARTRHRDDEAIAFLACRNRDLLSLVGRAALACTRVGKYARLNAATATRYVPAASFGRTN